ncbi:MAG: transposase family protein, partial [Syntrophales bacterium LBB04]|nr:transposase family protein [Syntrophales bacterium LBB04]
MALFVDRSFLVKYGPPVKEVYEKLVQRFQGKFDVPSLRTVHNYINSRWNKSEQLCIRDPEAWNRKYSPYVRRDWNKVGVNETWIGDAKQVDIACLYREKAIFPWISVFMDARSRKFVGWVVVPTHNSLSIGQAFLNGVSQCGPPKTVYIDRGKDYKSRFIAGEKEKTGSVIKLFDDVEQTKIPGILRELGVEIFFASPYNAREKLIESNFGIFTDRLRHLPGYRGHNTKTRPKKLAQEIKKCNLFPFEDLASRV